MARTYALGLSVRKATVSDSRPPTALVPNVRPRTLAFRARLPSCEGPTCGKSVPDEFLIGSGVTVDDMIGWQGSDKRTQGV